MNVKDLTLKKNYIKPVCESFKLATESLLAEVSANLPGGSTGTDMGGGEEEEPITISAKSHSSWESVGFEGWNE